MTPKQTDENQQLDDKPTPKKGFPLRYQLPKFPTLIAEALSCKDSRLISKDRNSLKNGLVQVLFDDIIKYTCKHVFNFHYYK